MLIVRKKIKKHYRNQLDMKYTLIYDISNYYKTMGMLICLYVYTYIKTVN